MKLKICDGCCRECSAFTIGTYIASTRPGESGDFVCADCDPSTFEIESERQKDSFLSGAMFDNDGVH